MDTKVLITMVIVLGITIICVHSNHVGRDISCLERTKMTCHYLGVKSLKELDK